MSNIENIITSHKELMKDVEIFTCLPERDSVLVNRFTKPLLKDVDIETVIKIQENRIDFPFDINMFSPSPDKLVVFREVITMVPGEMEKKFNSLQGVRKLIIKMGKPARGGLVLSNGGATVEPFATLDIPFATPEFRCVMVTNNDLIKITRVKEPQVYFVFEVYDRPEPFNSSEERDAVYTYPELPFDPAIISEPHPVFSFDIDSLWKTEGFHLTFESFLIMKPGPRVEQFERYNSYNCFIVGKNAGQGISIWGRKFFNKEKYIGVETQRANVLTHEVKEEEIYLVFSVNRDNKNPRPEPTTLVSKQLEWYLEKFTLEKKGNIVFNKCIMEYYTRRYTFPHITPIVFLDEDFSQYYLEENFERFMDVYTGGLEDIKKYLGRPRVPDHFMEHCYDVDVYNVGRTHLIETRSSQTFNVIHAYIIRPPINIV